MRCTQCGRDYASTADFEYGQRCRSCARGAPKPAEAPRAPAHVDCARCGTPSTFMGTKAFHEGGHLQDYFFNGLFTNREQYDVFVCRNCGRIELFLDGLGEHLRKSA